MAKVTFILALGENSAGELQINFRVYVSRDLRLRVPSGIWIDRKRWGKKNDINIPNIPGAEREVLLAKRAKLKELVDTIEFAIEKAEDKSVVTREWLEELTQKYLDESRGTLFPFISEQKYNVYIKEAFRKAGITRKVTTIDQRTRQNIQVPICDLASSHMARRTFIGNVYKSVKDPAIVGAMSGHKDGSRAFARYRDIDMDIKRDAVSALE